MEIEVKYPSDPKEKLYMIDVHPTSLDRIKEFQEKDKDCEEVKKKILEKKW